MKYVEKHEIECVWTQKILKGAQTKLLNAAHQKTLSKEGRYMARARKIIEENSIKYKGTKSSLPQPVESFSVKNIVSTDLDYIKSTSRKLLQELNKYNDKTLIEYKKEIEKFLSLV